MSRARMPPESPTIAGVLREHLRAARLTQQEAADAIGMHQTTLQRILSGRTDPPASTLLQVLGGLGLSLRWLHDRGIVPPALDAPGEGG